MRAAPHLRPAGTLRSPRDDGPRGVDEHRGGHRAHAIVALERAVLVEHDRVGDAHPVTNGRTLEKLRGPSTEMPMIVSPRHCGSWWSALPTRGSPATHGLHQVAQKSSSTGPCSSNRSSDSFWPSTAITLKRGAGDARRAREAETSPRRSRTASRARTPPSAPHRRGRHAGPGTSSQAHDAPRELHGTDPGVNQVEPGRRHSAGRRTTIPHEPDRARSRLPSSSVATRRPDRSCTVTRYGVLAACGRVSSMVVTARNGLGSQRSANDRGRGSSTPVGIVTSESITVRSSSRW